MNASPMIKLLIIAVLPLWLTACVSGVWTGATLIYDRHNVYKKISDFQLAANANRALYHDTRLKCSNCALDLAVFNGDILITGYLPNAELRDEAQARVAALPGYRRLFNQVSTRNSGNTSVQDAWITTKIRGQIIADANINPNQFKVVTSNQIVYLMGDVVPEQAAQVIQIARESQGVKRVVKLFKYFHLRDKV